MSEPPLVSCVVPTYNRPVRLREAVNCIVDQTYRPIELIIVDDASSEDYIANVVQDISDADISIQVVQHDENRGASAARNSGIRSANGTYIAFLDDDDQWLADKLEKQITGLEQSNSAFSYCWVRRVGPEGEHRATHTPKIEGEATKQLFTGNFTGTTSTVVVTKELCQTIGGFDDSLPRWNDWDFALRASLHTDFVLVSEILVHQFNWDGDQLSDNLDKLKIAQDRFITKHQELAADYDMHNLFQSRMHFGLGYSAGMSGNYKLARQSLFNAIKLVPYEPEFYLYMLVFIGGRFTLRPAQIIRRVVDRKLP